MNEDNNKDYMNAESLISENIPQVGKKRRLKIMSFSILIILCGILVGIQYSGTFDIIDYTKALFNPSGDNLIFKQSLCAKTTGTPSWYSNNGTLIGQGYIPFGNASLEVVNKILIPNEFYFVYSTGCGWCSKQIQEFGVMWDNYVNSGLTIDCSTLK